MNWAAGYNMQGYLSEMEPMVTADHERARAFLISEMEFAADYAADPDEANELAFAQADVDLCRGEFGIVIGNTSWWIAETEEEPDED